jgi:hypothetical protein
VDGFFSVCQGWEVQLFQYRFRFLLPSCHVRIIRNVNRKISYSKMPQAKPFVEQLLDIVERHADDATLNAILADLDALSLPASVSRDVSLILSRLRQPPQKGRASRR